MVNPVTGPFVTSDSAGWFTSDVKIKYKQARPYNLPLQYTRQVYTGWDDYGAAKYKSAPNGTVYVEFSSGRTKDTSFGLGSFAQRGDQRIWTRNDAYERLKGKVKDQAGWAENIAQATSARTMFNNRAVQLWEIVRFLTGRGKNIAHVPESLKRAFKSDESLQRLRKTKPLASSFLEVEYGWRPLVNDIRESVKIMTSEPDIKWVSAQRTSRWVEQTHSNVRLSDGGFNISHVTQEARLTYRVGAGFVVTNPNVFLANQLGIIDPALPWKLLPYSFVVDWFINLEQVVSSISDWFGLSLLQPYNTEFAKCSRKSTFNGASKSLVTSGYDTTYSNKENYSAEVSRSLGLPGPTLTLKPFRGFSLERGLQAISLIVSAMR